MSCTLALALSLPAMAQDDAGPTTREQVATQLEDYKERMSLSDYQWSQVEMILKSGIRERVAIARRYGLDGNPEVLENLSRKDKRNLRKELKESREETEDRMKRYLDKEQFKEFKAIQEEIHEQFLARVEERQKEAT